MKTVDWYFDFVSPFSYLQLERLERAGAAIAVRPRPILFAALLDHWGHKGPAEIPAKRTFVYRQVQWTAEHEGIALRFPPRHPFNPLRVLRLAVALDADLDAVRRIFRFIWRDGTDPNDPEGWRALCSTLGVENADALIGAEAVKTGLRRNGEEAIALGIFGVPTLVIGKQLFWGADATAMALEYLRRPDLFESEEMRRLAELPVGANRTR